MIRIAGRALFGLFILGLAAPSCVAERPAAEILADLRASREPGLPGLDKSLLARRIDLIAELERSDPGHRELGKLIPEKWEMMMALGRIDQAIAEIDRVRARTPVAAEKARLTFLKAQGLLSREGPTDDALPVIDEFLKYSPRDRRAASLLFEASYGIADPAKRRAVEDRVLTEFPNPQYGRVIRAARRRDARIGEPFALEFTDAISGKKVSMADLKGKVVVLDFWATWCGPCLQAMPRMKELYARYKDRGLEIVGVSLDEPKEQGGLDAMKAAVAQYAIPWPQYYQGYGVDSEFSKGWGVQMIPSVFVIDADGKLYATDAQRLLGTILPRLLDKPAAAREPKK